MAAILNIPITTALTAQVSQTLKANDLMTPTSALIQAVFTYGSGGTSFSAFVQTSLDFGTTWVDIWNFSGTTSSLAKAVNLTSVAVTSPYTPTAKTLTANTTNNGILGPIFRVAYDTVGVYAGGTTLRIDMYMPGVFSASLGAT